MHEQPRRARKLSQLAEADLQCCDCWWLCLRLGIYPPELFELIATSAIKFPAEEWDMISPEAKQCNEAMLQRDPKSRPTAQQLLQMPWLAKTAPVAAPMSQSSASFGSMTNLSSAQPGLAEFNEKRAAKPKRPTGAPPGGGFRPRPMRPGGPAPPARGSVGSGTRYAFASIASHTCACTTPTLTDCTCRCLILAVQGYCRSRELCCRAGACANA
jgi:serine/threonine protein kinase